MPLPVSSPCISPRLCLGTAQLGMAYGAANRGGMPDEAVARALVEAALEGGVTEFDTAQAYGEAEARLGRMRERLGACGARVITKLAPVLDHETPEDTVRQAVFASLSRLGLARLPVLLLHRAENLASHGGRVWQALLALQQEGTVGALGVSVTGMGELRAALSVPQVMHVQLPFNILDARFTGQGLAALLGARPEVEVFARSAFLQGVIMLPAAEWPVLPVQAAQDICALLDGFANEFGREGREDLCLAYLRAQAWLDAVVLGMENERQLRHNLHLFSRPALEAEACAAIGAAMPALPEAFLNPALWPKKELPCVP